MYPALALSSIEKYKATSFAGVSSHYAILYDKTNFRKRKFPSIRYFMQAGDAMHPLITKKIISTFYKKKLYIMYGQTEASPRITYIDEKKLRIKPRSVGRAVPGAQVRVVDKNGKECKKYEAGEVVVKGDSVMLGYLENKKETKKALRKGWLHTGDIAFKDNAGDLFIVGRIKDFVKICGKKVSLSKIEAFAMKDRRVLQAVAIKNEDKIKASRISLFIVKDPSSNLTIKTMDSMFKKCMPHDQRPSKIIFVKAISKRNNLGNKEKLR